MPPIAVPKLIIVVINISHTLKATPITMQSTYIKHTIAATIIQKFYHKYVKEQDYSSDRAYESYINEPIDGRYWDDANGYGRYADDDEYECDRYWSLDDRWDRFERDNDSDDGMYSLRNGGSTDDWETYIDNVYN